MKNVNHVEKNIAPAFLDIHDDIINNRYTHYRLKGGRGSTKSSFVSLEIIYGMMQDKQANAVVIRKVGAYLKDSVYEQLRWAIEKTGTEDEWTMKLSPIEMIYNITGQKILFRGADKPKKLKSTKVSHGYIKYVWYEELAEFKSPEEIRNINQSLLRGGEKFAVFYSYNPPMSIKSWVNREETLPADTLVHASTYKDVPKEWLGNQFILEAEHLREVNKELYEHEYMGKVTGTGGEVFTNLVIRKIKESETAKFDKIRTGIDFGYAIDPFVYIVANYDKMHKTLYIFDEIYKTGLSNAKAAEMIKEKIYTKLPIICDSAEPKSIAELRNYNLKVTGAKKGPDSIEYGIKFLQSLEQIVIDPIRCPHAAEEFTEYEIARDTEGELKANFPDENNHCIDAIRYALENDMSMRKGKVIKRRSLGL